MSDRRPGGQLPFIFRHRVGRAAIAVAAASALAITPSSIANDSAQAIPERSLAYERVAETSSCGSVTGARSPDGDVADWTGTAGGVTGTGYYAGGEYIWTDYTFDDAGTGQLTYPGEGDELAPAEGAVAKVSPLLNRYGSSAADVVEARFATDETHLHVAVVLNFLNALDTTVFTLGFDTDADDATGVNAWPKSAGLTTPGADVFVTAHPTSDGFCATVTTPSGEVAIDAAGGGAGADTLDNAIEIAIPRSVLGTGQHLEVVAGSGLWDVATGAWKRPIKGATSPIVPEQIRAGEPTDVRGGMTDNDPGVFNLLFRGDEQMIDLGNAGDAAQASSKRAFEHLRQAATLQGGTSGGYALSLDINRITPGAAPEPMPTRRGDLVEFTRQYKSNLDLEGLLWVENDVSQDIIYLGSRQSYAVHLPPCLVHPAVACPPDGVPLSVSFHGGSGSHINQLEDMGPDVAAPMAERAQVLTLAPFGRGRRAPWWRGLGEVDVLEAIADVEKNYPVDTNRRLANGGSLGGYATLRFSTLYPDMWAGAGAFCPATYENSTSTREPGNEAPETQSFTVFPLLGSLMNTPLLQVSGTIDPLVRIDNGHRLRDAALGEGLDLRYTEWGNGHHCTWVPETTQRFLDWHIPEMLSMLERGRATSPAVVRFAVDPRQFVPGVEWLGVAHLDDIGVRHDSAWWITEVRLRDDVISAAENTGLDLAGNTVGGPGDEVVGELTAVSRMLDGWERSTETCGNEVGLAGFSGNPEVEQTPGGASGVTYPDPHHFVCQRQLQTTPRLEPVLVLDLRNIAALAIDVVAAGMPSSFELAAVGDGAVEVTLLTDDQLTASGSCVDSQEQTDTGLRLSLTLDEQPCSVSLVPVAASRSLRSPHRCESDSLPNQSIAGCRHVF